MAIFKTGIFKIGDWNPGTLPFPGIWISRFSDKK
jgi:hypothetical protein